VRWRLIHHHDYMTFRMMMQQLLQKINDLCECDPLMVQGKHQAPARTQGRHRRHASSVAGYPDFARPAALGPGFAEQRRQANGGFVLAVQDSPGFSQGLPNRGHRFVLPTLAFLRIGLEVFPLGSLLGQTGFPKPAPNRIFRNVHIDAVRQNRMQAADGPEVGFKAKTRCGRQHNAFKIVWTDTGQLARPAADWPPLQSGVAAHLLVTSQPAMQGGAIHATHLGDLGNGGSFRYRLHCPNTQRKRRITESSHGLHSLAFLAADEEWLV
jgi:hypothetical protein